MDGVPCIGKISAIAPKASYENGKVQVQWQAVDKTGKAKIWLSTTNQFKTGGTDQYRLAAEVPVSQEQATIDVGALPADFCKIVIEAPSNTMNVWIAPPPK